jgi:nicotinamide-nucleotide amidase
MPSAEIITIGTEILLGEIVDTNTRYIARTLRGLGVDIYRTITIGDNVERIADAIRNSMNRAEIVITTGGLGPTVDDPTREAVAKAVGVETEFREDLWATGGGGHFALRAQAVRKPEASGIRAKGAIGIPNPVGTAPCFIFETERNAVISLPGVPNEMEHILHESIIPYLQRRFELNEIIKIRILHCAGLGEGMIDEKISDLETLSNPTVGLAAHTGVVDIRIAAKARDEAEADAMIAQVERQVRERLGDYIFGADEDRLEDAALNAVARRGWTLTAVESGLDGLLARKLGIPHTASFPTCRSESLLPALRAARVESNADARWELPSTWRNAPPKWRSSHLGEKTHRITLRRTAAQPAEVVGQPGVELAQARAMEDGEG